MYHITFGHTKFDTAILLKQTALHEKPIRDEYLVPFLDAGIDVSGIVAFSVDYDKKKPSAGCRKAYLDKLLPELDRLGVKDIFCCDGEYFKTLVKETKAEVHLGNVLPCKIKGFEHMNVIYGFNYQTFFYAPDNRKRLSLAIQALHTHKEGTYEVLGASVLQEVYHPSKLANIKMWLKKLLEYPELTIDIEAFSLKHYSAGIGTISFSWNKHSAVAFAVDAVACDPYIIDVWDKKDKKYKKKTAYIKQVTNEPVRALLKEFFTEYVGKMIWHNASYDAYVLVYQLWMADLLDREGLLKGLGIMTRDIECTQIITYLATNSCAGNKLGLKDQAHEFAGNYAVDVTDIRLQPLPDLLKYNAVDTCSTYYVWEKNYPKMVADDQEGIYLDHFKPYLTDVIDMQLTGMCLDMSKVKEADIKLRTVRDDAYNLVLNSAIGKYFIAECIKDEVVTRNAAYKTKVIDASEANFKLNLNSNPQLQKLLYDFMELPVIDLTDSKQPATGGKTLKKLINHVDNVIGLTDSEITEYKAVIQAMIDFALSDKILSSFIRNFLEAPLAPDGNYYLYGSYKLGGTVSGRLSSCLVGETMVQCAAGTKRLDEVMLGDLVPTHAGVLQPVIGVFDNGSQPVYRVTLKNGKQLVCTSNHRLLTEAGFLSLEDLLNENETNIRRRFTSKHATSFEGLPQLSVVKVTENRQREECSRSGSIPPAREQRRAYSEKGAYKSSNASRALCCSLTSGNATLSGACGVEFRGSCKKYTSTPSIPKQVHKGKGGECGLPKGILPETLISENPATPERESSNSQKSHEEVCRLQRVRPNTHPYLDAQNSALQLRASGSDAKALRARGTTKGVCSASYQRGQDRQSSGQLGLDDTSSTHLTSPRGYSPIVKIDYVGIRRVYDLEIQEDHCYIANGIYVHNSNPNMMNLPSGSFFAKLIKECFIAAKGWLFGGADFASLEDRISALTTKDPEKLAIYLQGFDGHSYRAYHYWPELFPDIDPTSVESINSIAKTHPKIRSKSKAPTFLCTYGGTWRGLMDNCGFSEEEAKKIEASYHALYKVSDQWVEAKTLEASKTGFVTCAFGLKLRTPLLNQVLLGNRRTPYEAEAEKRTAGNALGQSWGLLNSRAASVFMKKVRASKYALDIMVCAQIHDSIYLRWKDSMELTAWVNEELNSAMEWQKHPEIAHDTVKLFGEMAICYPTWNDSFDLPLHGSVSSITAAIKKEIHARREVMQGEY